MFVATFNPAQFLVVALIIVTLTGFFHKKGSLDLHGMIVADAFGLLVYLLGGLSAFVACALTFLSAELFTRFGRKHKAEGFERRTTENIIGNGLPALVALALGQPLAFFGALSAALSDTASSEIGMMSKGKPLLITTLKPVEKGTDGGVSLLGFVAAALTGLGMAVAYWLLTGQTFAAGIILVAGITGSVVDSLLGALLERKGRLNNMQVNFIASACGGLLAFALGLLI